VRPKIPAFLQTEHASINDSARALEIADIEHQLRMYERVKRQYDLDKQLLERVSQVPSVVVTSRLLPQEIAERIADYERNTAARKAHVRELLHRLAELESA
jgi:hypothetical protein